MRWFVRYIAMTQRVAEAALILFFASLFVVAYTLT